MVRRFSSRAPGYKCCIFNSLAWLLISSEPPSSGLADRSPGTSALMEHRLLLIFSAAADNLRSSISLARLPLRQ